MVSWLDSHIYMGFLLSKINPIGSKKVPCLTYHPLFSLVETPDGDQVAATSPSLFPNLWSLIEKYSGKMKGSTEPRLLFSSADILKKLT